MKKTFLIGIIIIVVVVLVGILGYICINKSCNKAQPELKEPEEQIKIGSDKTTNKGKKILVTYFSVPEANDTNKDMSQEEQNSTHIIDGKVLGNTQYVAQLISEYVVGDIYRIEPKNPYPTNHENLVDQAKDEQKKNYRPELTNRISNFDDYDIIYIGYPNWWGDMPMAVYTFLGLYDFSGKTVIPFNTHGGSGLSGTVDDIKDTLPGATIIENAFSISRNNIGQAPNEVKKWLKEIEDINE